MIKADLTTAFRGGLRRHLELLVLAAILPMVLWAAGLAVWYSLETRRHLERDLAGTAGALALAVDANLRLSIEALGTAAISKSLVTNDLAGFRQQAVRLLARHPDWHNIIVFDSRGQQVLNTLRPPGAPLPSLDQEGLAEVRALLRAVMEDGEPRVTDLFHGPAVGGQLVAVAVPVRDATGRVDRVLAAGLKTSALASLLARNRYGDGWFVALSDKQERLIARAPLHEETMGKLAPDWARQSIGAGEAFASGRGMDGTPVHAAFQRSEVAGWNVVFGAPQAVITTDVARVLILTLGFSLAVTLGSVWLARMVARRILRPVQALNAAARPYIRPDLPARPELGITELNELDRALAGLSLDLSQTRQRFDKVFSLAPVMLFVLDERARLIEVNDSWLRTLGYRREEVLGREPWDFHTLESSQYDQCVVRPQLLRNGRVDDMWSNYVTKSGDIREVLVSLRAEHDASGAAIRTVGALRDVTEQRRAERALERAITEAERANAAKTRFLAAASHDLRQPLQALSLYLDILTQREGDRNDPILPALNQCAESLSGLLNDMLDVARLDAGTIKPRFEDVPVSRLLDQVAAAWTIQAQAKGLRLNIVRCATVVHTDFALMGRVLSNLVANAVRYTDKGRVLVGCRRTGPDQLRIEVWDTGIGIPADKQDVIFDEFRQLDNSGRGREKGTGLGLAIVSRICGLLGHRIGIRSRPGRGSVFSVTLPTAAQCSLPETAPARAESDQTRRILVLDDEAHVRQSLALVLSELGHEVATAEGVEEALAASRRLHPDLVIADFRLGGATTGIEAVRAIRGQEGSQVPAVVLTGDTDPATIRHIVASGLHLLHKPLQVDALRTFLRQVA